MANKPIATPLPADLPTDWVKGQKVAPTGEEVGLPKKYGYNYQSQQINDAQKAINTINNAFDSLTDNSSLSQHVNNIAIHTNATDKAKWDNTSDTLTTHIVNTTIHTTTAEKAKWNTVGTVSSLTTTAKADVVTAVNEVNNKISQNIKAADSSAALANSIVNPQNLYYTVES